ncbi:hypothetical protein TR51_30450 [Kitasatospora griseola]|uniref:HEPN AbiU2-like domain-containing protein n=1 Tax=Kitasatospora griseola TaxID=2064 RepID=A0A0D0PRT0_KITGR|nr:hypothetical protein [Kitasatospora griseola]KIQ63107.1 hypothetical protein TR51_30450 [Kitasatospora griseola]
MSRADDKWQKWCVQFDAAGTDIQTMFHNRHVWTTIEDMWVRTGGQIELNTIVQNWFIRNYVSTQCTGIRRECDEDSRTSSLARCLRRLIESPTMANRTRYEAVVMANPEIKDEHKASVIRGFDHFALTPETSCLDQDRIEADVAALHAAAMTTRYYTNKIIAHRQFTDEKITLSWHDLNRALNTVGAVFKRYYRLRHPGSSLGNLGVDLPLGWEQPFRSAWCPEDFWPQPAAHLDNYLPGTATP